MIVIPAIDLRKGRCVRLSQGDFRRIDTYEENPAAMALFWKANGAERLHVVDLDGSLEGFPRQKDIVLEIVEKTGLPVEVGGGIRNMKTVEEYLEGGVRWVILGTAAFRDPLFVKEACREFPGRVILGIDAFEGRVAVNGWTNKTNETPDELALRFAAENPAAVIYTDISRDGMESGLNRDATVAFAKAVDIPVIASGGVAKLDDIERLLPFEKYGVVGVVIGKALYSGALSLAAAIDCAKQKPF
jgi:phosphoribosylformimino-5-aminoimidazole carboxamide ribotide isomerase